MSAQLLTLVHRDDHKAARQTSGSGADQPASRMSEALAALLQAPDAPVNLPDDQVHALLAEIARLHVELAAGSSRLLGDLLARRTARDHHIPDRLLTVEQAAAELGVNARSIRRRARDLPFILRLSGKAIRVSEEGLRRWMEARRGR